MRWPAILLLAAACTSAPPGVTTPAPTPPSRPALVAEARGTVVDARNVPVEGAVVTVRASQKPLCATPVAEATTSTDRLGRYSALLSWGAGPAADACVTVVATASGTTGAASGEVTFASASPATPPNAADVRVELARATKLTRESADLVVRGVMDAINGDRQAAENLTSFVYGGRPAVQAAIPDIQQMIGRASSMTRADFQDQGRSTRHAYRIAGSNGKSTELIVYQDETVGVWHPLLAYSARSRAFVNQMIRLINSNDAAMMARLLTADDIDFPEPKARAIVDRYRAKYDPATMTATFAGFDEARSIIFYDLSGTKAGARVSERIELGYGDGLLWLRGTD